jgi:integrase
MPKRSTHRLSDKLIRSLPAPSSKTEILYDSDLPGFGIRLTPTGNRAFVLNYVVNRHERRMTIGQFPAWSTTAAREEAKRLKRQIDIGIDPLEQVQSKSHAAQAERKAPSIADLFARYDAEHLPSKAPRSAADDRSMWRDYILPDLGKIKVAHLTHADVDALHAKVGQTKPVRANRVIEVLRKALNLAVRWGWRADNPATGVRKNREEKRDRYLSQKEILQLTTALANHRARSSADAILFLMLTGARRTEVLRATWDQFDLEQGIWTKPSSHTKQRKIHRVPLSTPAIALLRKRSASSEGSHVFPGTDPDRPMADVKRTWLSVCEAAGLGEQAIRTYRNGKTVQDRHGDLLMEWRPTLRLHDLRHTYASILASRGLSLPIIGAMLGHTQAQTTARYAHLLDDPLRAAAETAGEMIYQQPSQGG